MTIDAHRVAHSAFRLEARPLIPTTSVRRASLTMPLEFGVDLMTINIGEAVTVERPAADK